MTSQQVQLNLHQVSVDILQSLACVGSALLVDQLPAVIALLKQSNQRAAQLVKQSRILVHDRKLKDLKQRLNCALANLP
jgi:hypothetical protein